MIGGSITVGDNTPKGSIFEVKLKDIKICTRAENVSQPEEPLEIKTHTKYKDLKILAADDIVINIKLIEGYLHHTGAIVEQASNGREAIEKALSCEYDIILMDLKMPELSGIEAARFLKSNEKTKHIPIIALTALAFSSPEYEIGNDLFDGYLIKPFSKEALNKLIDEFLMEKSELAQAVKETIKVMSLQTISQEEIDNAGKVLDLFINSVNQEWQETKQYAIIDKIKAFADHLYKIAVEHNLEFMEYYSAKLLKEATHFDFENLPATLDMYNDIINIYKTDADSYMV